MAPNWHGTNKNINREVRRADAIEKAEIIECPGAQLTDKDDGVVVAVEKAVAVVMQESGRRALFDATQRLGANYREKVGLIKSESVGRCQWLNDCG